MLQYVTDQVQGLIYVLTINGGAYVPWQPRITVQIPSSSAKQYYKAKKSKVRLLIYKFFFLIYFYDNKYLPSKQNFIFLTKNVFFLCVFFSSAAISFVKILRVLRVLRPLRAINRAKGLKVSFYTMYQIYLLLQSITTLIKIQYFPYYRIREVTNFIECGVHYAVIIAVV